MTTPTSISLTRKPSKRADSSDEAFLLSFARNLSMTIHTSQVVPDGEVKKVEILAGLLQTEASIVASWLTGRTLPDALDLHKIAKLLRISVDDLFNHGQRALSIDEDYHCITVHSASSGDGYALYTLPEALRHLKLPRCCSMFTVGDNSMSPLFRLGDIAIYDYRVNSFASNGLYVLRSSDGYFVRRVVKTNPTHVTIIPDNSDHIPSEHALTDFAESANEKLLIVGRVVGRMNVGNF